MPDTVASEALSEKFAAGAGRRRGTGRGRLGGAPRRPCGGGIACSSLLTTPRALSSAVLPAPRLSGPDWWKRPLLDILAGTAGGIAGKVIEYPFDTIKVRMQAGGTGQFPSYANSNEATYAIWRQEGFKGFFRGMSLPLAGTILETSCLFTTNGVLKRMLCEAGHLSPDSELPMRYVALSGAGTGFVVSWVLTPTELVKCRLQVPSPAPHLRYLGPVDCLVKSIRAEGLRVLYRGHSATLLREVPGTMCWFGAYEVFVRAMTPRGVKREELPSATIIAGGALGGMAYWCAPTLRERSRAPRRPRRCVPSARLRLLRAAPHGMTCSIHPTSPPLGTVQGNNVPVRHGQKRHADHAR